MPRHRMQFKTWLRCHMDRQDLIGDFARDWHTLGWSGDIEEVRMMCRENGMIDWFNSVKNTYDAECGTAVFG